MLQKLDDDQWGNSVFSYTRNAFQGTRKERNRAHQKLLKEVRGRGFLRPGEDPPIDYEEFKLDPATADWTSASGQLMEMMQKFTEQTKRLTQEQADYDHLVNVETGQKIYMKELFFATMLWPIEDVLELVPTAV